MKRAKLWAFAHGVTQAALLGSFTVAAGRDSDDCDMFNCDHIKLSCTVSSKFIAQWEKHTPCATIFDTGSALAAKSEWDPLSTNLQGTFELERLLAGDFSICRDRAATRAPAIGDNPYKTSVDGSYCDCGARKTSASSLGWCVPRVYFGGTLVQNTNQYRGNARGVWIGRCVHSARV